MRERIVNTHALMWDNFDMLTPVESSPGFVSIPVPALSCTAFKEVDDSKDNNLHIELSADIILEQPTVANQTFHSLLLDNYVTDFVELNPTQTFQITPASLEEYKEASKEITISTDLQSESDQQLKTNLNAQSLSQIHLEDAHLNSFFTQSISHNDSNSKYFTFSSFEKNFSQESATSTNSASSGILSQQDIHCSSTNAFQHLIPSQSFSPPFYATKTSPKSLLQNFTNVNHINPAANSGEEVVFFPHKQSKYQQEQPDETNDRRFKSYCKSNEGDCSCQSNPRGSVSGKVFSSSLSSQSTQSSRISSPIIDDYIIEMKNYLPTTFQASRAHSKEEILRTVLRVLKEHQRCEIEIDLLQSEVKLMKERLQRLNGFC